MIINQVFKTHKNLFFMCFMLLIFTSVNAQDVVGGYIPHYRIPSNPSSSFTTQIKEKMKRLTHIYYFSVSSNKDGDLGTVVKANPKVGINQYTDANFSFTPIVNSSYVDNELQFLKNIKSTYGLQTKIILVLGGETSSRNLHYALKYSNSRNNLAEQLVDYCYQEDLDGIDIDWESYNLPNPNYDPNDSNSKEGIYTKIDPNKYVHFVNAIKGEIDSRVQNGDRRISISLTLTPERTDIASPLSPAFSKIDYLQIMSYGSSRTGSGTQVPISKLETYRQNWANKGLSGSKLVIGLPCYAVRSGRSSGYKYNDIVNNTGSNFTWPYSGSLDKVYISSENAIFYLNGIGTMGDKADWVNTKSLKGVMFWEIGQDVDATDSNSLLKAVTESKLKVRNGEFDLSSNTKSTKGMFVIAADSETIIQNNNKGLSVYPNPFNDVLNISFNNSNSKTIKIIMYDIKGSVVWQNTKTIEMGNHVLKINTELFNKGFYVLKYIDGDNVITRNVLKN